MEYIIDCNMAGGGGSGSSNPGVPLGSSLSETVTIPTLTDSVEFQLVTA